MGKYLTVWTMNPNAPWPTNPADALKLNETFWAAMDGLMKKGEIIDFGWFMDGRSGYAIGEGDSVTVFKNINMFSAYFDMTVEEIIPYETGKQVNRAHYKALIAMAKQ